MDTLNAQFPDQRTLREATTCETAATALMCELVHGARTRVRLVADQNHLRAIDERTGEELALSPNLDGWLRSTDTQAKEVLLELSRRAGILRGQRRGDYLLRVTSFENGTVRVLVRAEAVSDGELRLRLRHGVPIWVWKAGRWACRLFLRA